MAFVEETTDGACCRQRQHNGFGRPHIHPGNHMAMAPVPPPKLSMWNVLLVAVMASVTFSGLASIDNDDN